MNFSSGDATNVTDDYDGTDSSNGTDTSNRGSSGSVGSWIMPLAVCLAAFVLIAIIAGLLVWRSDRKRKAEREQRRQRREQKKQAESKLEATAPQPQQQQQPQQSSLPLPSASSGGKAKVVSWIESAPGSDTPLATVIGPVQYQSTAMSAVDGRALAAPPSYSPAGPETKPQPERQHRRRDGRGSASSGSLQGSASAAANGFLGSAGHRMSADLIMSVYGLFAGVGLLDPSRVRHLFGSTNRAGGIELQTGARQIDSGYSRVAAGVDTLVKAQSCDCAERCVATWPGASELRLRL